ncbi:diguanylate cyclase [Alkalimonas delamerensis]|uniref:diguanylate cyclase n=1 Tax=Alkalimonas delamerensis TaxID=265981 RepID=A0ABT9GR64_9GAMM|nr:diguanylate cyclase [Alkalimonas delamerensis]MDP4529460.1 diguanylate cyclase [Alkalimonas delamerensis]
MHSYPSRILLLLLAVLVCGLVFWSTIGHAVQLHAAKVELPETMPAVVYGVTQDQQNFQWLAAEFDGLLRFDGQQYLRFAPPALSQSASYSQVISDSQNQLWVGTWGSGLWRLDELRKNWQQVTALPEDAQIQSLHLSSTEVLWIGTTHGLYQLASGSMHAEPFQPLAGQRIWHLAEQGNGTLWVATSNGLYQLFPAAVEKSDWLQHEVFNQQEIRTVEVSDQLLLVGLRAHLALLDISKPESLQLFGFGNPNTILAESAGSWLVGSIDGMFRVWLAGSELQSELLLPAIDVRHILRDKFGQIWLGSRNSGLLPLMPSPMRAVKPDLSAFISSDKPRRLGPSSLTSTRWQALEQTLLQLKNGQWHELMFMAEYPVAYVRDVVEFGPHTLASTDKGLFRLNDRRHFVPVPLNITLNRLNIERMAISADGALWLGLWEEGVIRIPAEAATQHIMDWQAVQLQPGGKAQDGIVDIQIDARQRLWLLSRQGRLYLGEQESMTLVWQPDSVLATGYFQCMLAEKDVLWLCSDRGLIRLSQDLTEAKVLGQAEGLPDQRVIGITRTDHFIWVLTRNGVLSFKPDGTQLHLMAGRRGLDFNRVQLKGLRALSGDKVQLATSTGIWQLSQDDMTPVPDNLQLHLTSMRLNRQLFSLTQSSGSIQLPKSVDELQLQFQLLTFQPHLRVQYFFRWQGQQEWNALGQDALLTLSQLAPGTHRLEIMARAGGQEVRTEPLVLHVPIPFWQRPAGIALLGVLSAMLLFGLHRLHTRRLEQRAAALDLVVAQRTAELEQVNRQLKLQSNTDSLTGLLNRRALYAAAALLQAQRCRTTSPLTLVLMDIDHFKQINDCHGHHIGDAALKTFASFLKKRLRGQDLIARWGGEEFLLLMPQTDLQQAAHLMEELRVGMQQLNVPELTTPLSATFGISPVATQADALEQAVKAADMALYQGKALGRDRIVLASQAEPSKH